MWLFACAVLFLCHNFVCKFQSELKNNNTKYPQIGLPKHLNESGPGSLPLATFRLSELWPAYCVCRQPGRRLSDGGFSQPTLTCLLILSSAALEFCLGSLYHWSSCENSFPLLLLHKPLLPITINYSNRSQLGLNNLSAECQYLVNNLMQLFTIPQRVLLSACCKERGLCHGSIFVWVVDGIRSSRHQFTLVFQW